jgi:hypothetical protein
LAGAIERGQPLSRVPDLLYKGSDGPVMSEHHAVIRAEELTTPEYVNLRPGAVLGLETSSRCSWGRCAFCVYSQLGADGVQADIGVQRTDEQMVDDAARLAAEHDPSFLWLTDHTVSPARLRVLAEANQRRSQMVPFAAFLRLERAFESPDLCKALAAGGFLGGQAGLEAGSDRVNRLMNKGIDVASAPQVLRNFRDAGLMIHLYTMVGFPGETEGEAQATFEFLKTHRELLTLDWHVFWLGVVGHAPLAMHPERFGLTILRPPPDALVPYCGYVPREGLMSQDARRLAIEFEDKLAGLRHPLSRWMDNELYKLFLLKEKADAVRAQQRGDASAPPERC